MTKQSLTTTICSDKGFTRRALLSQGAAASALVPLAAVPALAATGADAELKALWGEYLSAVRHHAVANKAEDDAGEAAAASVEGELAEMDAHKAAAEAAEAARRKVMADKVRLSVEGFEIPPEEMRPNRDMVAVLCVTPDPRRAIAGERWRILEDAERRHGVPELKAARDRAWVTCASIAEQIDETPAHTFEGVAIKMAYEVSCGVEPGIENAYQALVALSGTDPAAELEAAERYIERGRS